MIHDQARHWSVGRVPGDELEEHRYGIHIGWRFHVSPSRFRFVPGP